MSEEKVYGELIWLLAKQKKQSLIDFLIKKLKKEGKIYLFKNIVNYLEEKYEKENNFIKGNLKLAFQHEVDYLINFLEKKLNKRIKLDKVEVDENLILGGVFVSKNIKVDFSFKNLINKILSEVK